MVIDDDGLKVVEDFKLPGLLKVILELHVFKLDCTFHDFRSRRGAKGFSPKLGPSVIRGTNHESDDIRS